MDMKGFLEMWEVAQQPFVSSRKAVDYTVGIIFATLTAIDSDRFPQYALSSLYKSNRKPEAAS
jgi:hypothetical protein